MANEQNLKSFDKYSKEERKKLGAKGGRNSGKSKRKKADLKKAINTILELDVTTPKSKIMLESMGVECSNQMLLAVMLFKKAVSGNQKAVENLIRLVGTKDKYDIDEQKARIKKLKTGENTTNNNANITIVDRWINDDI